MVYCQRLEWIFPLFLSCVFAAAGLGLLRVSVSGRKMSDESVESTPRIP